MRVRNRFTAMMVVLAMMLAFPSTALANDDSPSRVRDRAMGQVGEQPAEPVEERVAEQTRERVADRPVDRPSDHPTDPCRLGLTDRVTYCVTDRPVEPPVHECLRLADNPRRCFDDLHPHDFNIRQLIWRLIHAHEWELLHRLLHWLVT